ncbi:PD-(D/E)XK nuclease family protein [Flagellimonas sp. HMM57]|uniref:PD-(D/E)XK nuclease family protein n=1 Tax=unclassified Flagellimonas TaxID=2644544 RepID=UPI0013D61E6E|nr:MULTISPECIES: PD-(D/E)XK nuclease family protein [unclassified Flagellimonas]UII77803.1 PD-(D/E)XK nuclease family protein [Flagellimonas sp. HMM57]
MHQSFLEHVLYDLQKKEVALESCTFILPSKRSGTFLKKYISSIITQNIFSPEILSIEDFVSQISGIVTVPPIDLLLELYSSYKNSKIKVHDDFNTFLKWGQTLLQDFNEIDRYLIPAKDILNYLSAIKELTHWSLQSNKTELVQNYMEQWQNLEVLYNSFTVSLLSQNKGYQGLVYRKAVENLDDYSQSRKKSQIIFIGFNALNTAESIIVQHFLEHPDNKIYWDIDSNFLDDPIHDAGLFIRNYQKNWSYYQSRKLSGIHNIFTSSKSISITGVPKSISQAKYVGNLLQDIQATSSIGLKNTALVLADESLLNPVLQAIPQGINEVNITMGLPLEETLLFSFFITLLELNIGKTEKGWFYKDVLKFTSNPYFQTISASEKRALAKNITADIKANNWLYLNSNNLSNYHESQRLIDIIFPLESMTPINWVEGCLLLIQMLKEIYQKEENSKELEYLYRFYTIFNQLKQHVSTVGFITNLRSIRSFFAQLSSIETLDFIGEPLSGLQIMGMLESRNLDFETIILTSVNEGILPSGKSNNSFIPFDVKREYGLPTYKEKDAIYTYHFYRLLQRAKNIHIIYNTEPDVLEGGEKSRLISQLLTDEKLTPYITYTVASPQVDIPLRSVPEIIKSPLLYTDIKTFANTGFSPTSLTNYIKNPIEFYKRNILKINDVEKVQETIAANTFGTVVHDSLDELYQPFIGRVLTMENFSPIRKKVEEIVVAHFHKNLPGIDITKGKFLLVFKVIVKYLNTFIDKEVIQLKKHEIRIVGLEQKFSIALDFNGVDFPIKLKGTLDRIDEVDGILRIVDYKTGRVEPRNVKIKDWEELITNYDKSKAFQLLCYAFMYSKQNNIESIQAGIYSFKNLNQGFLPFYCDGNSITKEVLKTFEAYLEKLICEICDPAIPFSDKIL